MSFLNNFAGGVRNLFRKKQAEREMDDELRAYLDAAAQEKMRSGMSPEQARREARMEMGSTDAVKEGIRGAGWESTLEALGQDIRYGTRQLRRSPGLTAVAIISLALGIGANTAIFSMLNAVLLKSLPVRNPGQLVLLEWVSQAWPQVMDSLSGSMDGDDSGRTTSTSFSYPAYEQLRDHSEAFASTAALAGVESELNVGYAGQPGRALGELVSGNFFSTLGIQSTVGRLLTPEDDRLQASPAAVISYGYWQRRFGGDASMLGRSITVNSVPFTIVGISPADFLGVQTGHAIEVWLPLHSQPQVEPSWSPSNPAHGPQGGSAPDGVLFTARDNWWVVILARLKPGVSATQAKTNAEVIFQQAIGPDIKPGSKPQTIPHLEVGLGGKGFEGVRGDLTPALYTLMAMVGVVLLIACANVANLMLARSASRRKEIAVRLAVGAGRGRLIRQLLTESILLAGLGGAAGFALSFWGTDLLVALLASGRERMVLSVTPDLRVLCFAAAVSLLTGILCGISPALRSTHMDLTPALKRTSGALQAGLSWEKGRRLGLGKALVVAQVALSVLLLVGAAMFVRTLANLQNLNAGFNTQNLLLFQIDPTQDGYSGPRLAAFYQELARRLESAPGVRSVSLSFHRLLSGAISSAGVKIPGYTLKPGEKSDDLQTYLNGVGSRFFETMGIPVLLGRAVDDGDTATAPRVAVVNQAFVRRFLGDGNPVGRSFSFGGNKNPQMSIAGVAGDAKYGSLRREVPPTVYLPYQQNLREAPMDFEVRAVGNPVDLESAVYRVAKEMDQNLALYDVNTQVEEIDKSLFQERLFARLTGFFGALAALLACVGIYGVMAFTVARRTREIGIRMALGASRGEVTGMVLRETSFLMAIGIVVGIALAAGAMRLISSFLYGLKPTDPATLALSAFIMAAAGILASYVPSRRASRVDPLVALRED